MRISTNELCFLGKQIVEALENGVSQWPKLEGRFPQVSGCSFHFDPSRPAGERIDPKLVKVQGEHVDLNRVTSLLTIIYF